MYSMIEGKNAPSQRALATAQLATSDDLRLRKFEAGQFWIGRAADADDTPIGYADDRHVCLVSGSRGGKGTSTILNNLALWPGSLVVIDPKGENASVIAARRSGGSEYAQGLDQLTYVLDPFKAAQVEDEFRATFNPLDALDPDDENAPDEAGRLADAMVVSQGKGDPYWDEQARTFIKGLILHVITNDDFEGRRNLITVRQLVMSGDIVRKKRLADDASFADVSAYNLLFVGMQRNEAFHGIISGVGENFGELYESSPKTFSSVISNAANHTEFIDSVPMRRFLESTTPGLKLSRLKTDPSGISIFLSLPQRQMNTHFRWLRMMVALIITEMEKTRGQPATGHRVLMCLDEFAGLKKMEVIENAAAQIAGFGVKLFFVLQSLAQLKTTYGDGWEIFMGNAGLKMFYSIEDGFTREYVSKLMGETEVIRDTQNSSETRGTSASISDSSTSGSSSSDSSTYGSSTTTGYNGGGSTSSDIGLLWNTAKTTSSSSGWSTSTTSSSSHSSSKSSSYSNTRGVTQGSNESQTAGSSQTIHKRALLTPDEIGMLFSRIDDESHPAYPGLVLALIPGARPVIARRVNYFEDELFEKKFDPHPDHGLKPVMKKPAPVIVPAKIPEVSARGRLASTYGEVNAQTAYEIIQTMRNDYPHLKIHSLGEDAGAEALLKSAQNNIQIAAKDGRPHTLPETLKIIGKIMGKYMAQNNPPSWEVYNIEYGDEHRGKAGKRAAFRNKIGIWLMWICTGLFVLVKLSEFLKK